MAAVEREDSAQVKAALILVTLRHRKLQRRPEWVPMASGEASSLAGTVATEAKRSGGASSSAGTVAAGVMRQREASSAGIVEVPKFWPQKKRSGSRGETSREPEQGHAASTAAAKGSSGAPRSSEQERCAEMPAASAQQRPVVAALCYAAVAGSGTGPSSTSAAPAKETMETPSPDTPLEYGAGGSGAPSSVDDAAPARPQAKRKGTGGDDEGCSSRAKRGPVSEEEKAMPMSGEPSAQSETRASSGKGAPFPFDLNLPCTLDEDEGSGCPDAT